MYCVWFLIHAFVLIYCIHNLWCIPVLIHVFCSLVESCIRLLQSVGESFCSLADSCILVLQGVWILLFACWFLVVPVCVCESFCSLAEPHILVLQSVWIRLFTCWSLVVPKCLWTLLFTCQFWQFDATVSESSMICDSWNFKICRAWCDFLSVRPAKYCMGGGNECLNMEIQLHMQFKTRKEKWFFVLPSQLLMSIKKQFRRESGKERDWRSLWNLLKSELFY
jgi:hypothetical protein